MQIFINVLYVLCLIIFVIWLLWLIGFPIYKKIKNELLWGSYYTIILCVLALLMNIINLILQILRSLKENHVRFKKIEEVKKKKS